ncbi:MAG: hypothetical protein J6M39_06665 [Lachnospiraceae bacterium]|nr:hypothetical protein [Lachnospiraceae bacterium]
MIKLTFTHPLIEINGNETIMSMWSLIVNNKHVVNTKKFTHKVTLKSKDKYDLNNARNILQAQIEQDAYKWAKNFIDKEIKEGERRQNIMKAFSEKAAHIIEHDENYINKLINK